MREIFHLIKNVLVRQVMDVWMMAYSVEWKVKTQNIVFSRIMDTNLPVSELVFWVEENKLYFIFHFHCRSTQCISETVQCKCVCERERVCVCVCVRERERERESKRE